MNDVTKTYKILEIKQETPTIKTFTLDTALEGTPGQFVMVWVPGVDEIPISISNFDPLQITVKEVGEATKALHKKRIGDYIGIRGPYGNGFGLVGERVLVVGGGVGIAPLRTLMKNKNKQFTVVLGAQTKSEIFFEEDFKRNADVFVCTDDGSYGKKAFATQLAEELIQNNRYDMVVACGPEIMLKYLFGITEKHKINAQFSMERWMKCGVGLCGHCSLDPTGWRVCKEGPVFSSEQLRKVTEFFRYKRDQSGTEVEL
ncbi:MAG: dihydroorotate dehydrogenase electron transfer subunit [Candidatus Diapherotrites archaeon]|nr:dihydroorotate dehydrogenase electron transfer subunit [Candidatus Diapherotrites archaeon]